MAKITNTETPEDFALHLLDQLMEKEGDKLTTFQVIQAAQAYATAGMAQATREAGGNLDSIDADQDSALERHNAEEEGRARRLGNNVPVILYVPGAAEGSPGEDYSLVSNGKEMYWVHKNATDDEKKVGIELIRFFEDTQEEDKLEHVENIATEPPLVVRAYHGKPDGDYDHFDRDEGKFWVHRSVTFQALPGLIKALLAKEDEEWEAYADDMKSKGLDATQNPATGTASTSSTSKVYDWAEVHSRETTKVLPTTLREKIEAAIKEKAESNVEEIAVTVSANREGEKNV